MITLDFVQHRSKVDGSAVQAVLVTSENILVVMEWLMEAGAMIVKDGTKVGKKYSITGEHSTGETYILKVKPGKWMLVDSNNCVSSVDQIVNESSGEDPSQTV